MSEFAGFDAIAQIAVGLVGFAALLNFLNRNAEHADRHTAARGDAMLELAAIALLGALLPSTLYRANVSPQTIWVTGSALLLVYYLTMLLRASLLLSSAGRGSAFANLICSMVIMVGAGVLQGLSVFFEAWPNPENAYYLGVVALIVISVSTFLAQYKLENPNAWRGGSND